MTDPTPTFLLPCTCGRDIRVEPRQAGDTVRCECGVARQAPTLREIRNLPRAVSITDSSARPSVWGTRQRLLVSGTILLAIAAMLAIIVYSLRPAPPFSRAMPEAKMAQVRAMSTAESVRFFQRELAPGLHLGGSFEEMEYGRAWERVEIALIADGLFAAAGLVLIVLGLIGVGAK